MSYALIHSRALDGLHAPAVQVEVHLANGLPGFTLVGLADTEVKEARERVRAALAQSGFAFPHNRRITVSLAPAELPKESGRFDLPIALGLLAADGQLDQAALALHEFAGELSLAGELRPVRGALALALAARQEPMASAPASPPSVVASVPASGAAAAPRRLVLPLESARWAACVPGVQVLQAAHLAEVVQAFSPGVAEAPRPALRPAEAWAPAAGGDRLQAPDLADVKAQAAAKRALEVAAAGGHNLLMTGPPGSGKTMLAQRLPGILPRLTEAAALQAAAIHGLRRDAEAAAEAVALGLRPFRAPHHSASMPALVGGGSPPRPGEVSLAHGGVLFLDELPEFSRQALEALREPLENGFVTISRAARQARFPARFQCIAAMNPCPCGWLGAPAGSGRACRCTPEAVQRYQARVSGPLRDRFDIAVEVLAAPPQALLAAPAAEPSAVVAERVAAALERQQTRQGMVNSGLDASGVAQHARPSGVARALLEAAAQQLGWSARALHRACKLARTVADLEGATEIGSAHVAEAVQYRRGLAP